MELAIRAGDDADYWFLINRTGEEVAVGEVAGEVLRAPCLAAGLTLAPRQVCVLRRPHGTAPVS
ncbi:Beta-galactosidase C-terminal domain [Streptosporangium sp. NPDC048865]|uniref:Beta-galactosidase C-terminal domain n=1 Tax=Streptosporangium sp. NPDC048865 TaxID=3155766 RepID=UPI003449BF90